MPVIAAGDPIQEGAFGAFGTPGLIDMPIAIAPREGTLSASYSGLRGTWRGQLTFQATRRLGITWRYAKIGQPGGEYNAFFFDRSFDLHYQLMFENSALPGITLGLRDFAGTGLYGSEFIAVTKTIVPSLRATGGIGWGRMASYGGFTNPLSRLSSRFLTRSSGVTGRGGIPEIGHWFTGNAAFFGGIEWQATRRLRLKAEYSSDAYVKETLSHHGFTWRTPINIGVDYQVSSGTILSAYYLYGDTLGLNFTLHVNPNKPLQTGTLSDAPLPVLRRLERSVSPDLWSEGWAANPSTGATLKTALAPLLKQAGMTLVGLDYSADHIEIHFSNERFDAEPQALGRISRILSRILPASVERFDLVPVVEGLPTSKISFNRSDLERLENDPDATVEILTAAEISAASRTGKSGIKNVDLEPAFSWRLGSYAAYSLFDPDNPFRVDLGAELKGSYRLTPRTSISFGLRKKVIGNMNENRRVNTSAVQPVRSNFGLYDKTDGVTIQYLTADHFFKAGPNIYGHLSAGYLERMFAGAFAELLWKPVHRRLAFGADVAVVEQRAYDQLFGALSGYDTILTGHISAYYAFKNGFHTQVDVGRYLAGDTGATLTVTKEFANGWKVGAFITLTDMPFATFGEGSFDKGITLEIPVSWIKGEPNRKVSSATLRPLTRDGGQKLDIRNRLYEDIRDYHQASMEQKWGRFWR